MIVNTNITETDIESAITQAIYYSYGCPLDAITLYANRTPLHSFGTNKPFTRVVRHEHDEGWVYKYIGFLPNGAGWVMWSPWWPLHWYAIIRLNPYRAKLTLDDLARLVKELFPNDRIMMGRVECKLDLCGWDPHTVYQHLWAPRLSPKSYSGEKSTTYYLGKTRNNGQIKVYDKAIERGWNLPELLTRLEKTYAWKPDDRLEFNRENMIRAISSLRPFHDVHLIDFSGVKGSERLGRLLAKGMAFTDILRSTKKKNRVKNAGTLYNDMIRYAKEHPLCDLAQIFDQLFTEWYQGTIPLPATDTPYEEEEENIKAEVVALEEDGELLVS